MSKKRLLELFLIIFIPLATYTICKMSGLKDVFAIYAAVTSWAVYAWVSLCISPTIVAVALPVLYILSGITDAQTVFSPWHSTLPWLCLSGILIGQMLLKSGFATRLSYYCIILSGDSFYRILIGLMLAGFIIAPLIPTALGKIAIFCALGIGICDTMKLDSQSKESAAIMMTCLFAVVPPSYAYLTGCVQIPAAVSLMEQVSGIPVGWFNYAYHNFVPGIIYSLLSFSLIFLIIKPQNIKGTKQIIVEKYNALGKISLTEKKAICILIITLLFLTTESIHKIHSAWGMVVIALIMFFPGVDLMEGKDFDQTNISMIFFLAGAMSVGAVAAQIGVAKEIAIFAANIFTLGGTIFHMFGSFLLGFIAVFFLTPLTGMVALSVPLTELALQIGTDPRVMIYSFNYGMDMYLMPYQYGVLLFLCSYKRIAGKYLLRTLAARIIATIFIFFPILILYWKLIGLW